MTFPTPTHRPNSRFISHRFFPSSILFGIAMVGTLLLTARAADTRPAARADTSQAVADTTARSHRVLAYYFHTTQRCATCRKIEAYTAEAIQVGFPEELRTGRLVFQALNVDEPDNQHFLKDYKLYTKSVVLVEEQSGKQVAWKQLPKIWELVGDKEKFAHYIQGETRAYLTGLQP
jgi:hypothetical protein